MLILATLLAAHAEPIINGEIEEGYPSVVGLGILWGDDPMVMCTGNMITPRVVLSAGHCSADVPVETVVKMGRAFFGTDLYEDFELYEFSDGGVHPDYDEPGGFDSGAYDLAVLALEEDSPVEPTRVRLDPLDESYEGTVLRSVGFGITSPNGQTNGVKYSVELELSTVTDMHLKGTTDTDAGEGNICSGDSGGPMFVEEDGRAVEWAVHSYGDVDCSSSWGSTRADIGADWILDFIEDVHGTDDLCEINGWYEDGQCDPWCDAEDPDCSEASRASDEETGGLCASAGGRGAWWLALVPLVAVRRRRCPSARP